MDYTEILANRVRNLDRAADYVGEALNIIQDMSPYETDAMRRELDDLYTIVFDTMLRIRKFTEKNPDEKVVEV